MENELLGTTFTVQYCPVNRLAQVHEFGNGALIKTNIPESTPRDEIIDWIGESVKEMLRKEVSPTIGQHWGIHLMSRNKGIEWELFSSTHPSTPE